MVITGAQYNRASSLSIPELSPEHLQLSCNMMSNSIGIPAVMHPLREWFEAVRLGMVMLGKSAAEKFLFF